MSFHAEVPLDADIMEAHDIIDHIERELTGRFIHIHPVHLEDHEIIGVQGLDRLGDPPGHLLVGQGAPCWASGLTPPW